MNNFIPLTKAGYKGWRCSSVIEYFPNMYKDLGSIPITVKQ